MLVNFLVCVDHSESSINLNLYYCFVIVITSFVSYCCFVVIINN